MNIINHAKRLRTNYDSISNNKQLLIFGTRLIEARKCWESELEFTREMNHFKSFDGQHPDDFELKKKLRRKFNKRIRDLKQALDILSSFDTEVQHE